METKERNKLVFDYVLDCIDLDGFNLEKQPETDQEKLQFVVDTFKQEYNDWNKRNYPNLQLRFSEWLKGLPSSFNVDFENYKILQIAKEWGSLPENAKTWQEDKILNNWFNFIAAKFFVLCRKNKVNTSAL